MLDACRKPVWTVGFKQNWADAYDRLMAWWAGESIDRPVILADVPKPDAKPFQPASDPGTAEQRDLDENYQFLLNQHFLDTHLFLAESAPGVRTGYASSIGMLSAIAGGKLIYGNGTVWTSENEDLFAGPLPDFAGDFPPYVLAKRLIRRHDAAFGHDCVLGADAMMDPLTTLSSLRGVAGLCLDLHDRPDDVRRWLDRLSVIRQRIAEGYSREKKLLGRSEDYNWTQAWAPGDMDFIECDFSTMISPEMFHEWVMPEVEKEASFYQYVGWHLDGSAEVRHLPAICSVPNLTAIQWVSDKSFSIPELIDLFRQIRLFGRSVLFAVQSVDEAVALTKGVGRDGMAFSMNACVRTEQEMETAIRRLRAL